MIKLSKIKIFKRTVLSVLSLTLLLGGAFFAAKMVKTFHVNAAETDDTVGAAGDKVTVSWPQDASGIITYGEDVANGVVPARDDHSWVTRDFTAKYVGSTTPFKVYCAQPSADAPSQTMEYSVTEVAGPGNNEYTTFNAIKLLIYLADTAEEKSKDPTKSFPINTIPIMNDLFNGMGEFNDNVNDYGNTGYQLRYAYVHAVIGYLYNNQDVSGLSAEQITQVENIISQLRSMITDKNDTRHDIWLVAQNSTLYTISTDTQQMVWIELEPQSGNIEVKKCDSKTQSKCSGEEFDGIKFTLYNNSGHRIYAAGINENGGPFFDNGAKMLDATITGGTGKVTFSNLPLGVEYKIVESGTNNYYILTPPTSKTITLDRNGGTGHLTFNNKGVSLGTTATDASDGDKFVQAGTKTYIKDVVEYCVVPGQTYTVTGVLMDKTTGEPLLIGGKQVTGDPVPFTPTESCGTVEMIFELDSSELGGKDLVVFEYLSLDNELITSHEEIDDPDQTIRVVSLGTTATDASDGDKTIIADGEATINDRIKYCLVAGKEYTIIGTLMNKSTREPIKSNNEVVSKPITITPEEDCGEVDMEFKFDTTGLGGTDVVVFEKALILNSTTDDYDTIASHEDLDDEGQTIKIVDKAPETGMFTGSASSTTGGINILVLAAAGVSVIGVGGYLVTRATAKKRFMSRR